MNKFKKVYFVVSANPKIGFGHMKRCMLIAEEFRAKNVEVEFMFFNSSEMAKNEMINQRFENKHFLNPEVLIENIQRIKGELSKTLLIIDSDKDIFYENSTQNYLLELGLKFMFISIKNLINYKSHYLFNQNIMALSENYDIAPYTKTFFGPEYFVLEDELSKIKVHEKKDKKSLIVAFGSSDPGNVTYRLLPVLSKMKSQFHKIRIVVGGMNPNVKKIKEHSFIKDNPSQVELYVDTKKMYDLMAKSDVGLTSMGLTFWELTLHGIPSLVISGTERERSQIGYFCSNKFAYYIGDFDQDNFAKSLRVNLENYFFNSICLETKFLRKMINIQGKTKLVKELLMK